MSDKLRQKIIGTYYFGYEQVQVVLREGTGGEFYSTPEKGSVPRIKIGADYKDWDNILSCLIHELMELVMFRNRCRYDLTGDISCDHNSYLFVMRHNDFSDCCAKVAEVLSECLPELAKEWKRFRKNIK